MADGASVEDRGVLADILAANERMQRDKAQARHSARLLCHTVSACGAPPLGETRGWARGAAIVLGMHVVVASKWSLSACVCTGGVTFKDETFARQTGTLSAHHSRIYYNAMYRRWGAWQIWRSATRSSSRRARPCCSA